MSKKKFFIIVDTETTQTQRVADFGAVVCDRKGNIVAQCGVLVRDFYLDREQHPLFHTGDVDPLWGKTTLPKRYSAYDAMLNDGRRMLASVPAINRWLGQVAAKYQPTLTAYNLAFDVDKLNRSGIAHDIFPKRFCLWHAAASHWGHSLAYRRFVLETVAFNNPTSRGNMSYVTNAETIARFVTGTPDLPPEPHTALEDARDYELPILRQLLRVSKAGAYMDPPPYNWQEYQVKDWFKPK